MQVRLKGLPFLIYYYMGFLTLVMVFGLLVPMRWSVHAQGFIEPLHKQFIKPDVGGVISEVFAEAGQHVEAGQVIARLADPQITIDRMADNASYEKAKLNLLYAQDMEHKGYLSKLEVREAELGLKVEETKRRVSKSYDITAPVSGVLLTSDEFNLREGDKIDAGTIIATVADLSDMRMKVRVTESDISQIQVGDPVRVYVNSFPAMLYSTVKGTVHLIQPQAQFTDGENFFLVVITIDVPKSNRLNACLMPGMAGSATIVYEKSSFFHHAIERSFDGFESKFF